MNDAIREFLRLTTDLPAWVFDGTPPPSFASIDQDRTCPCYMSISNPGHWYIELACVRHGRTLDQYMFVHIDTYNEIRRLIDE